MFVYDDNGNVKQMTEASGATMLVYDAENRLISISRPGFSASYKYNADGHRLEAVRNGTTTRYILDPLDARENVISEMDGSDAVTAYYVHGPQGLIARLDAAGANALLYHTDQIGSTMAITDAMGTVIKAYNYDEFGEVQGETGTLDQPFQFVGGLGVMEETSDLLFMRARFYNNRNGAFLGRDLAQDLDSYRYARDNPLLFFDPTGLYFDFAPLASKRSIGFIHSLIADLDRIGSTPLGNRILGFLQASRAPVYFDVDNPDVPAWNATYIQRSDTHEKLSYYVVLDGMNEPTSKKVGGYSIWDSLTGERVPSVMFGLAHELTHIVSFMSNQFTSRPNAIEEFGDAMANLIADQSKSGDAIRETHPGSDYYAISPSLSSRTIRKYMTYYNTELDQLGVARSYPPINWYSLLQSRGEGVCPVGGKH